jgi:hypothetical protein
MTNHRTAKLLGDPMFRDEPLTDARKQWRDAEREMERIEREQKNQTREERIALGIINRENKYNAVKTTVDGYRFDSKAEAARYGELKLMQQAGDIENLEVHPRYKLVVNGVRIGEYIADFRYYDPSQKHLVVEDVKSKPTMTPAYRMKSRLMKALYGIDVIEVEG